ncbi:hypothetical protein [Fimbriiglobus ruber]|uniref:hypothetical protein n=1 Tax=Fimbriiglobus ruber TaxID=1908690 RepID=UPI000B4B9942|nr:hypothetical protein [Fimbriiglobus ruber]
MESVKEVFAFVGVVVGAITGIMAFAKTYLDLKKRLAEERAEQAAAKTPPAVSVGTSAGVPIPTASPATSTPALPTATPTPTTPTSSTTAPHKDHDKLVMAIALQAIGVAVIIGAVVWLLYPIIYPPPLDLTKPRPDPSQMHSSPFPWPGAPILLCFIGNGIWSLGRGK